jgi:hypothetical protein
VFPHRQRPAFIPEKSSKFDLFRIKYQRGATINSAETAGLRGPRQWLDHAMRAQDAGNVAQLDRLAVAVAGESPCA